MVIRRRRGFTLIELTISIVLLTIGLLALTGALARALHEVTRARLEHAALRRAESVADSLALEPSVAAGAISSASYTIRWAPVPCALGTCVRVRALTTTDTLAILSRVAP